MKTTLINFSDWNPFALCSSLFCQQGFNDMVSLYTDRTCVLMFSQIFAALFGPLRGYIYVGSSNIPFRAAKIRYYSLKNQAFVQINIVSITYFSYTSIKWWLQEEIAVIC